MLNDFPQTIYVVLISDSWDDVPLVMKDGEIQHVTAKKEYKNSARPLSDGNPKSVKKSTFQVKLVS